MARPVTISVSVVWQENEHPGERCSHNFSYDFPFHEYFLVH